MVLIRGVMIEKEEVWNSWEEKKVFTEEMVKSGCLGEE